MAVTVAVLVLNPFTVRRQIETRHFVVALPKDSTAVTVAVIVLNPLTV